MTKLADIAEILRSKNAGPFYLTIDFLFSNKEKYGLVKGSNILNADKVSKLYQVHKDDVKIYYYDKANGIKITIPRKISSGSGEDTDVYGAQQHIHLMELEIE